jgi:hypothetical protein
MAAGSTVVQPRQAVWQQGVGAFAPRHSGHGVADPTLRLGGQLGIMAAWVGVSTAARGLVALLCCGGAMHEGPAGSRGPLQSQPWWNCWAVKWVA